MAGAGGGSVNGARAREDVGVLEGAVNAGEAGRMLGVVQTFGMAGAAPRLFKMLLPQVLEGMARRDVAARRRRPRACAELLMTLAEGAPKMVAKLPQGHGCSRCSCR